MTFTTRIDHYEANAVGRDLVVGDIHGRFSELAMALQRLQFDPQRDRLFSVGDLIDRGPESAKAQAWLDYPWFKACRGNHEEALVLHVTDLGRIPDYLRGYGAEWTAAATPAALHGLATTIMGLPLGIEVETGQGLVGILHGDLPGPSWHALRMALADDVERSEAERVFGSRAAQTAMCCVWGRGRAEAAQRRVNSIQGNVEDMRAVILGHTPMPCIVRQGNVLFIDTVNYELEGGKPWRYVHGALTVLDLATLKPAEPPSPLDWTGVVT